MRTKKRPQYIQELVKETNKRLEVMNIKDEGDTLFRFVCTFYLKRKCIKDIISSKRRLS